MGQGAFLLPELHLGPPEPVVGIVVIDLVAARPETDLGRLVTRGERLLELRDGLPEPPFLDEIPPLEERPGRRVAG